ncbi:ribonucleoside-triphosphate reductase, adenosylcobalamin-dependent [Halobacillus ihumii]|uniref:ribonucleoside-triphosphate reductase, adenosylcobalamin-dependent n=1 Tax=Halobacillus ihumii TaxID=2686092 RepID=UPI001966E0D5|nr:ribonucleoside-triphosphate reductase, adenosylcobalamin-dependent [Halobacillus ihumii]
MAKITLSNEFVEFEKENFTPHWGELGWVTYKRTYARWIEEKGRKEEWHETVKRVVEGNVNLDPRLKHGHVPQKVLNELQREAQDLYHLIYTISGVSSGRNLWISGTEFAERNGDALNNCWFIAVRPQAYGDSHIVPFYAKKDDKLVSMPFSFLFDQSMKGGGVGFSAVDENMKLMPKVDREIETVVVTDKSNGDYDKLIEAGAVDKDEHIRNMKTTKFIAFKVPDKREGWVEAEALVIDSHFEEATEKDIEQVIIDVSSVREEGEPIKGFGGIASGAKPLVELLFATNKIVNEAAGRKLSSVESTDIMNLIGKTVVAGNVRRTAEIALGSPNDSEFITMKQDTEKLMSHRWASNNSVIVDRSFDDYDEIANALVVNGEPAIVNMELSKDFGRIVDGYQPNVDPDVEGTNPCGEISLANGEPCNLFEVFPLIAERNGIDVEEAYALAARFAKRVTFSYYEWEVSRNVIQNNRRIGVSMSGIQDWALKNFGGRLVVGFEEDGTAIFNEKAAKRVDELYQSVKQSDIDYSEQLGCNPSVKLTTVKPSGTVSKLAGMSEGVHFHYDSHLIQRIRFQANDPLLVAIKLAGYHIEDDEYSANTKVVEFLVEAPSANEDGFIGAGEASIEEQFANQAFMQRYWADNSVSCTITFQEHEGDKIADLFRQYRDYTKSTSLLPFAGHGFVQAPKEPITKETYENRKGQIRGDIQEIFTAMNQSDKDVELVGQSDCESGSCPIK